MKAATMCREPCRIARHWPEAERPTTRLLTLGVRALADSEVLAIVLRYGIKEASAVDVARAMLTRAGSISALLDGAPTDEYMTHEQRAAILAGAELARRALHDELRGRDCMSSPRAVRDYLRLTLSGMQHEVFTVMHLDAQHRMLRFEELFRGTLTQTSVYPREVVKTALACNSTAVIFAHNHPSGVAEPSHADEILTRTLKGALAMVDVQVLDHFIIAAGASTSFAERGLL
jgi:DNA repair protein RadC